MTMNEAMLALDGQFPVEYDGIRFSRIKRISIVKPDNGRPAYIEYELIDSTGHSLAITDDHLLAPASFGFDLYTRTNYAPYVIEKKHES